MRVRSFNYSLTPTFTNIIQLGDGYAFQSSISMSYIEVYGDQVFDLLKNGKGVGQSKVSSQRYVLNGNVNTEVHTISDIIELLKVGDAQKRKAATAMNDRSSRAHSIIILTLQQECLQTASTKTSRLFLADLGGSENVKKSLVEAGGHKLGVEEKFSVGFTLGKSIAICSLDYDSFIHSRRAFA